MSIFSDYECGAMSDVEFHNECVRMNAENRDDQDCECDDDCEHCIWTECPKEEGEEE